MQVIAIIPVFNAEKEIRRCLKSLSQFVDGIVVLDDGSTDQTPAILREYEKVIKIITNPPETKTGWDDGQNHCRLNEALLEFSPEWVIRLDQDETFDVTMAEFLPELIQAPKKILAYAFPRHILDESQGLCGVGKRDLVRMYRYSPESHFQNLKLHSPFEPLKTPTSSIRQTNIRMWHHSSFTAEMRNERYEKFQKYDPLNLYQNSYENLLHTPRLAPVTAPQRPLVLSEFMGSRFVVRSILWFYLRTKMREFFRLAKIKFTSVLT